MDDLKLDLNIYDIWHTPFWQRTGFLILSLIFSLILFASFIYFLKKRNNKNKNLTVDDLINQINNLKKQNIVDQSKFYTDLIHIIKQFILINYNQNMFSKTESEIIEFLQNKEIDIDLINKIELLIYEAINTKFSKIVYSEIQMVKKIDYCYEFIMTLNKNSDTTSNNKTT